MTIEFTVPVRIESANVMRDRHWSIRKRKTDEQKSAVFWSYRKATSGRGRHYAMRLLADQHVTVTLTRIGPRKLDSDNLTSGFKSVRDQVADILGVDDGDERVEWICRQERGRPREYAARIRIETKGRE